LAAGTTTLAYLGTLINHGRKKFHNIGPRFKFAPGTYVIVPCTFAPDEEGEFLLRVLAEEPAPIQRLQ
jgi:hypothetical protein